MLSQSSLLPGAILNYMSELGTGVATRENIVLHDLHVRKLFGPNVAEERQGVGSLCVLEQSVRS